ncbi:flavodoxin-dependent (E)-4-hydroxy-3-methylbut-2-enyl-diphosphate synthase, partial [Candidatus Calescamantes bacterium]|nr:flavodoxin-dependent (E)-4-hydroxy-3-methylbut-2-enyl-diphosphate synthase [Candidatus Calescamantes bacterium]
ITEAGGGLQGVVKSSVGIGILLWNGIGDTVRVSLTGPSQEEVEVAYEILKSLGIRKRGPEFISCPTCGRARINVMETMEKVREFTLPYTDELSGLKIAVMGCEVNGPGEAREADLGLAGGKTYSLFFKKGEIIRKVKKEDMVNAFKYELKKLLKKGKPC